MGSRRAHCTVIIFPDWILLWLARHKRQHLIEFNPIRLRFQRVWRLFRSSSGALSHQFESHAGTISKQYRADSLSLGAVLAHPRHFFDQLLNGIGSCFAALHRIPQHFPTDLEMTSISTRHLLQSLSDPPNRNSHS